MSGVLLTNALLRKTLAAVRSLGKKGIETYVVDETRFTPAAFSKYCTKGYVSTNTENKEEYFNSICNIIKKNKCEVFFPMDEDTMNIAQEYREEITKLCHLPIPSAESYNTVADKGLSYKHALRNGVDYPRTAYPEHLSDIFISTENLRYPLIVKPVKSNGGRGIVIVEDKNDLEKAYLEVCKEYPHPVIQEYIGDGEMYDVVLLYNSKSQLRAHYIQKQVRKFPLITGPSSVQESVAYPEMMEIALKYMEGLEWYGIADLEFMVKKDTEEILFIELNGRFWNSLQMGIYAEVDFPWLLYKIATEGDCEMISGFKTGVYCRNLLPSDILHYIFNKNRRSMDPPFFGGRKRKVLDDIISKDDPFAVVGFIFLCFRYLFSKKMWKTLLRR